MRHPGCSKSIFCLLFNLTNLLLSQSLKLLFHNLQNRCSFQLPFKLDQKYTDTEAGEKLNFTSHYPTLTNQSENYGHRKYQSLSDCSLLWPHQDQRKGEAVHRRNRDTEMAGPARWVLRTKDLWDQWKEQKQQPNQEKEKIS